MTSATTWCSRNLSCTAILLVYYTVYGTTIDQHVSNKLTRSTFLVRSAGLTSFSLKLGLEWLEFFRGL